MVDSSQQDDQTVCPRLHVQTLIHTKRPYVCRSYLHRFETLEEQLRSMQARDS